MSTVVDLISKTLSTMPWSGILILLGIAFIIRLLEGGFDISPKRSRSKPQRSRYEEDEDDPEFEWVRVRRRKR